MSTYVRECGGDKDQALALYRANASIGGVAFTALHYFEVILRNAIDRELRTWNVRKRGTADWALDAAPLLLQVIGHEKIRAARDDARRAVSARRDVVHDDVVAQFSLGTWRFMLPSARDQAKQSLWEEGLERAFSNRHDVRPDQIAKSVSIVYDFRNRVAHHEPVFHLDLRGKRKAMRDVLQAVGNDARKWFVTHDQFSPALTTFYEEWPQFERKN